MKKLLKIQNIKNKLKNLSRRQKRKYVKIGFFIFGFLLLINISIMMGYLLDQSYNYKIFDNAYTQAVLPEQSLDQKLKLDVIKYKKLPFEDIKVGDQVVVDGDFNIDVYWVETVVSIDSTNKLITTSYDQQVVSTYTENEIIGMYIANANFIGSIYYTASFLKGFIFITLTHGIFLFSYYYILINKEKEHSN